MHPIFVLISNTCTSYTRILSLLACTFYHLDIVYVLKNILNQLLVVPRRKQSLVAFEPPTPQWRGRSYWQRPSYGHLMIATFHLLIDNSFLKVHLIFATSHITMKVHSNLDVVFIGVVWQPTDVDLPDRVHHSRTHLALLFFWFFFWTQNTLKMAWLEVDTFCKMPLH